MLDERGRLLRTAWVAARRRDGRCSWFRERRHSRGGAVAGVPSNTLVRDLLAADPLYAGRGPGRERHSAVWIAGASACRRRRRRSRSGRREGRWR